MKHKTYFVIFLMAAAMTGCLKVQKKDEKRALEARKAQQVKVMFNRDLVFEDIAISFLGQPRPNVYDVNFEWPNTRDRLRIRVGDQVLFQANTSEVTEYTVKNFQGGDRITLLVEILDEREHIISATPKDIEIPKDHIYQGPIVLEYDTKIVEFERVFMDQAVFTTQNFLLEIKTKELIVLKESIIQGFAQGSKAPAGFEGRSGGLVNIEANSAEGKLTFILNSEGGGDGLRGYYVIETIGKDRTDVKRPKCPGGGSGFRAGRNADLRLKINNIEKFSYSRPEVFSEGGNPGPKLEPASISHPAMSDESNCPQNPTKGEPNGHGFFCLISPDSILAQGCE